MEISNIIKLFSDQTRLRIINIIKEETLCVGEIQTLLNIKQSNVSRHLDKLKSSEIIIQIKNCQWIYYSINKEIFQKYSFIEKILFEDINKETIYKNDLENLKKYKQSKYCCQDLKDVDFNFNKINFNN